MGAIVVVDYCKGNLKSVERGLEQVGAEVVVSDDPRVIESASAIVLPGVGAFADASDTMRRSGQMQVIRERIAAHTPFLGICLGMHLLFEEGIEGTDFADEDSANAAGLAVLPGVVTSLPKTDAAGRSYKVPHVGWNSLAFEEGQGGPLLRSIEPGEYFYFTHSYRAPETPCTVAETRHSTIFPSVVSYRDYAFGVQFHPEKSSEAGAVLLKNFLDIVKGA